MAIRATKLGTHTHVTLLVAVYTCVRSHYADKAPAQFLPCILLFSPALPLTLSVALCTQWCWLGEPSRYYTNNRPRKMGEVGEVVQADLVDMGAVFVAVTLPQAP
jgi:hypothetical protein